MANTTTTSANSRHQYGSADLLKYHWIIFCNGFILFTLLAAKLRIFFEKPPFSLKNHSFGLIPCPVGCG